MKLCHLEQNLNADDSVRPAPEFDLHAAVRCSG